MLKHADRLIYHLGPDPVSRNDCDLLCLRISHRSYSSYRSYSSKTAHTKRAPLIRGALSRLSNQTESLPVVWIDRARPLRSWADRDRELSLESQQKARRQQSFFLHQLALHRCPRGLRRSLLLLAFEDAHESLPWF